MNTGTPRDVKLVNCSGVIHNMLTHTHTHTLIRIFVVAITTFDKAVNELKTRIGNRILERL